MIRSKNKTVKVMMEFKTKKGTDHGRYGCNVVEVDLENVEG